MKIVQFEIRNFRGIKLARADNLGSAVIIAGQNGSGKSCVLDALRLLKSAYGGYQQNEWHHWMGEFSINMGLRSQDLVGIFNTPNHPVSISFKFQLHPDERAYIRDNIDDLLLDYVWRIHIPDAYSYGGFRMASFAAQFREREPEMRSRAAELKAGLERELEEETVTGTLSVQPGGRLMTSNTMLLPITFSQYLPGQIGILDYHGPQRHYGRDPAQSVSINLDQSSTSQSHHALYNYSNKYSGIKSEMAAAYVREILAEQAGMPRASQNTLTNTLMSLFETFFPDKRFLGPIPTQDGTLSFPVETPSGGKHDLDELSSGEKEILYGYLRMRNSAPRYSVILIDEPELHLNPRLISGLPQFYAQHLGVALDNQIWLITHSDALLRESVGNPSFNVFHMQPCVLLDQGASASATVANQLKPLSRESDLDLAIADLVGDLAAYQPDRKVVIFEGGGDSDFDKWMTSALFPKFAQRANLISGTNKAKVTALHDILDRAFTKGEISTKFFAITDSDYDSEDGASSNVRLFKWPAYHIENFLIDARFISLVVSNLYPNPVTPEDVMDSLRECARSCIPKAIRHHVVGMVSRQLVGSIDLSFDPRADNISEEVYAAATRSRERMVSLFSGELSLDVLAAHELRLRETFEKSIDDGTWIQKLPGRDILRAYSNRLPNGISHETLRTMIVNRMVEAKHSPAGMQDVIIQIDPNAAGIPGTLY